MYIKHDQSQEKENSCKSLTLELILLAESEMRDNTHRRAVFNVLMLMHNRFKNVYLRQELIAQRAHCSVKAVQRALKFFRSIGWLWTQQRYDSSLIYYFNPIFNDQHMRDRLKYIYSAFNYFLLANLFVSITATGAVLQESVSLLLFKDSSLYKKRVSTDWKSYHNQSLIHDNLYKLRGNPSPSELNALTKQELDVIFSTTVIKKRKEPNMRMIIHEAQSLVALTATDIEQLDILPDTAIAKAIKRVKEKGEEGNKSAYFMSIARYEAGLGKPKNSIPDFLKGKTQVVKQVKPVLRKLWILDIDLEAESKRLYAFCPIPSWMKK